MGALKKFVCNRAGVWGGNRCMDKDILSIYSPANVFMDAQAINGLSEKYWLERARLTRDGKGSNASRPSAPLLIVFDSDNFRCPCAVSLLYRMDINRCKSIFIYCLRFDNQCLLYTLLLTGNCYAFIVRSDCAAWHCNYT